MEEGPVLRAVLGVGKVAYNILQLCRDQLCVAVPFFEGVAVAMVARAGGRSERCPGPGLPGCWVGRRSALSSGQELLYRRVVL